MAEPVPDVCSKVDCLRLLPQLLLCGLFGVRDGMAAPLRWLSDVMPLTYAVDGMQRLTVSGVTGPVVVDIAVVLGAALVAVALEAATLLRHSE